MYTYVATALIAAAIAAGTAWQVQGWRWGAADADRLRLEAKGVEQTRAAERRQAADVQGAIDESRTREQAQRADAAGLRAERVGLQHDLAAFKSATSTSPASCPERADTAADLFEQCSATLEELAGKADRHASDALMLLQAWPK